jgi:hypothetical protein
MQSDETNLISYMNELADCLSGHDRLWPNLLRQHATEAKALFDRYDLEIISGAHDTNRRQLSAHVLSRCAIEIVGQERRLRVLPLHSSGGTALLQKSIAPVLGGSASSQSDG